MTYLQAIRFLDSFVNYEKISNWTYKKSIKLKRIQSLLDQIGNPQNVLKCVHVAGSKGKGSTCAFIANILRYSGFKVGLYTSPHLVDFRERIRILEPEVSKYQSVKESGRRSDGGSRDFEGMISRNDLVDLVQRVKPDIKVYNKKSKFGPLTFFEVYTALAFLYFKEQDVDFVVLETGMGGRLDATNVVDPYVCVLTPISYEHTQKLGNTLSKIAFEKAGIIKGRKVTKLQSHKETRIRCKGVKVSGCQKVNVISAPQEKEAMGVFEERCAKNKAELIKIKENDFRDLKVNLIGDHQKINAACAVEAVKALSCYGIKIKDEDIRKGLLATRWPCRCEVVSKNPLFILDGAQNSASVKVLINAIKKNFKYKSVILILGISDDKDIEGICRQLNNFADTVVVTKANNPRAADPQRLAKYFSQKNILLTKNTRMAKNKALKIAEKGDLILVTGSLFVTGEFKKI